MVQHCVDIEGCMIKSHPSRHGPTQPSRATLMPLIVSVNYCNNDRLNGLKFNVLL